MNYLSPGRRLSARRARGPARTRGGFTLVEILVVLAIIAILAALLFPAFKSAQQNGRQASCASNLKQIYAAVMLYKQDEGRFPGSIAVLLSSTEQLDATQGMPTGNPPRVNGNDCDTAKNTCPNARGTGFLKSSSVLVCPDDDTKTGQPRSSYSNVALVAPTVPVTDPAADVGRYIWNYWGYKNDGFAYQGADMPADQSTVPTDYATGLTQNNERRFLRDPSQAYAPGARPIEGTNPIDLNKLPRLANRNAPAETIITHCVFHRIPTSNLAKPTDLSNTAEAANAAGAKEIVLRLDGSSDLVDATTITAEKWIKQTR